MFIAKVFVFGDIKLRVKIEDIERIKCFPKSKLGKLLYKDDVGDTKSISFTEIGFLWTDNKLDED